MAETRKIYDNLDLRHNRLINGVFDPLPAPPLNPVLGQFYYDTILNSIGLFNGVSWIYAGVSQVAWGQILGTLSNQTDLQTELNTKLDKIVFLESSQNKDSINLVKGTAVTQDGSGSGFRRADCSAPGTFCIGVLYEDINTGFSGNILTAGTLTISDWTSIIGVSSLSAKTKYYLSTSGQLVSLPSLIPGQILQFIGTGIDTQSMKIEISNPTLL
jgi:hypothetical protein